MSGHLDKDGFFEFSKKSFADNPFNVISGDEINKKSLYERLKVDSRIK